LCSIVTMAISCIICKIKRDFGLKNRDFFHITHVFDAPVMSPSEYCHNVWQRKKLEWLAYQVSGVRSLMVCLAVSVPYRRVTDGQRDGQTSCESIVRAVHTRRAITTEIS